MKTFQDKEIRVYIASPYTNGWMPTMVKLQLDMAQNLLDEGYFPYPPLLNHFQEIYSNRTEHEWLKLDFVFLKVCDAVLRLFPLDKDGKEIPSSGADQEIELAIKEGIPVFYSIEELNDYFKAGSKQLKI
jgi:hypothetical protein